MTNMCADVLRKVYVFKRVVLYEFVRTQEQREEHGNVQKYMKT